MLATAVAVSAFVLLYEASVSDSRSALRRVSREVPDGAGETLVSRTTGDAGAPGAAGAPAAVGAPGSPGLEIGETETFTATAYCKGTVTASGVAPRAGVAAADPKLLPVGSVVRVDSVDHQYSGIYTIMDTGPLIRGNRIDIYMWSCHEALRFGKRKVEVLLLRHGWDPRNSPPELKSLFGSEPGRLEPRIPDAR